MNARPLATDIETDAAGLPRFPTELNLAAYYLYNRLDEGRGERIALRFGDHQLTYREVAERSLSCATVLRDAGLAKGERALLLLRDIPAFAWSFFGTLTAGGVIAMGNPDAPIASLAYLVRYTEAAIVFAPPRVLAELLPLIEDCHVVRGGSLRRLFAVAEPSLDGDPFGSTGHEAEALAHTTDLTTALRELSPERPRFVARTHRDEPAIWLFTSGSTGHPKAAMHAHGDFAFNTEVFAKHTIGLVEDDITVSIPRLFFGYATGTNLLFPFAVGASVGLFPDRPTVESFLQAIDRYRPTILTQVPTMMGKILDEDGARRDRGEGGVDLSSVRFSYSAGEALPEPLLRRWQERFASDVYDGIGSAEMFHIYASNRPGDVRPGTLGRVVDGYTLRILPEEAEGPGAAEVPRGEIGVLWVRGPSAAFGYFKDREKSFATFLGPWCRTGDLFHLDEDGYLVFDGRADDLLKVSGIFVSPLEVESCLLEHADVALAAVIGADDQGLIKPKALVVVRPHARERVATEAGRDELAESLKAHVKARLAKHKYPRWIVFCDDLPKNDRGKVDRKALKHQEKQAVPPAEKPAEKQP
jgi:benzoate-CoA ligase family protein